MKGFLFYAAKGFLRLLLLLLAASAVTFALVSASPIDPLQQNVGQAALGTMSREQRQKLEEYWGKDTPPVRRYLNWLTDLLRGDMGTSLRYRRPVGRVIGEKLANSLWLTAVSWLLSGVLGLLMGIVAGAFADRWPDRLIGGYCLLISSTPVFWLALLLLLVFGVWLGWFPIGLSVPIGMEEGAVSWTDRLYHAVLPAAALSVTGTASIALHTRQKMREVLSGDYMLYARARGESRRGAILRHGLRNLLLPAMTLQFASVGEIIGGSVMVEQVFSYPGLGQAAVTAGLGSDVPLLLGIVLVTAGIVFAGNWAADLLYRAVDPRMRTERRRP